MQVKALLWDLVLSFALLFYDFFFLGDDRDAEEVKFVHGTLTGGGELESTSSGPHL